MAERQISLFENDISGEPEAPALFVISQPNRPLTKAQQTFNRRVARVEELRMQLDREIHRLDKALAYYGEHIHPRLTRQTALRKDLVRAFALFLDHKGLKLKWERKTLRRLVAEQIDYIIGEEGSLSDEDIRALFKRTHGIDFDKAAKDEMEQVFSEMESMFGDIGIEVDFRMCGRT